MASLSFIKSFAHSLVWIRKPAWSKDKIKVPILLVSYMSTVIATLTGETLGARATHFLVGYAS